MDYDYAMEHGGIDESAYKHVFYGDVEVKDLEDIYQLFNSKRVPTH